MNSRRAAITRRRFVSRFLTWTAALAGLRLLPAWGAESAAVGPQPYFAGVNRTLETLAGLGAPITTADAQQIAVLARQNDQAAIDAAEKILGRYTLARVDVASTGITAASAGGAERVLAEQGWRLFLVRISNPSGVLADIALKPFPNVASMSREPKTFTVAQRADLADTLNKAPLIRDMWLQTALHNSGALDGSPLEYRVIELFSRDRGRRSARFEFVVNTDKGLSDSFNNTAVSLDFNCLPSRDLRLRILDVNGEGCVCALTIKDHAGRVYPPQAMRLAPDMRFEPHIYRADGETVRLPDGEYTVRSKRGPEYTAGLQTIRVAGDGATINVQLTRWIDPAKWGWYSGDTHLHAAGCSHYDSPTEGVTPETMIRHVRGEGLAIGDVLTWGPGWYYQKQFFSGRAQSPSADMEHPELQAANSASLQSRPTPEDFESQLRYDIEVSGFPSSMAGHLILLRLKDQDYPGTKLIEDWPSWNLPILKWGKTQGSVVGYAHCGLGMFTDSRVLPNYEIPPFDSVGVNEAIVDVTHQMVDFLSGCERPPVVELNAWYHLLNCGFRPVMAGETDYPCYAPPTDARPGIGRSYVRLKQRPTTDGDYDTWVTNLKSGRLYHGDGRSHFLEFTVEGHSSGDPDVILRGSSTVQIAATVAAWLDPAPTPEFLHEARETSWNLELARMGSSRNVPLELVVNGLPVEQIIFLADGTPREIAFKTVIPQSSWIALRILPSSHTYPVYVQVEGKPIRASSRSARWCRTCVDKLWLVKSPFLRDSERADAAAAYDHARRTYDTILRECEPA